MSMIFPLQFRAQTALAHRQPGGLIIPNRQKIAAPAFGLIPNQVDQVLAPIPPLNLAGFLSAGTPPFIFEDIGGLIPPGLVLDVNTGIVTGTPTTVAAPVLVSIRATNGAGQDVGSFTWEVTA